MSAAPPRRRTQEERKAESERAIIRAALNLFAKQGYLTTTLNEIGKAAGYTGGLVSHRFGSKVGLLSAVIDHIGQRFLNDQLGDAIEAESAAESLRNYIDIYLGEVSLREGPIRALYVIMGEALGAVPEIKKAIARLNAGAREVLGEIIQQGIDSGEFRAELDVGASAALIIGSLRGTVMQHLIDPHNVSLVKMKDAVKASAIGGLKTQA